MSMIKLNERQDKILSYIRKRKSATNKELLEHISKPGEEVTRLTIVRDLDKLLKFKLISKMGGGRNVSYKERIRSSALSYFDVEKYFKLPPDERDVSFNKFNFDAFGYFDKNFFSENETSKLEMLNQEYQERIKKMSPSSLKKEFERLTIELSWKSSQIEGNTYSLIDTEILIKEGKAAKGHSKDETMMILNHKKAIDYIFSRKNEFKSLNLRKIENVHSLLIKNLSTEKGIRKRLIGITGTKYRPLDNQHQIREAMEKLCGVANASKNHPLVKALAAILLISYIQPFEDGNKRTARLVGNAVLFAHGFCPLSYRSVDEAEYKKAILLFYEQNSARYFKELFVEQFRFAVKNYFLI
ncbi:MAG: Fic family protein [Patescibacteria group bacterium]|nr:Fic family protein [Patescibacteria group bacterium]